ncbi:hypothetical protein BSKO_07666 [Bryopsis sp. KO-2023]|nr:hypothetical protein BSKO_07666 [Bryopsis sp. KO-2023]
MALEDTRLELNPFSCSECYVYAPIPHAGTIGHRAEVWDVDNWAKEVVLRVVTRGDDLCIRLLESKTDELFAECPVPNDTPVVTVVEPVVDSSRYYVLKIVDQESGRHAFIGIGFRDREKSSDFSACLNEHRQYLRRKEDAKVLHEKFEGEDREEIDYSLKPGTTIRIELPKAKKSGELKATPEANLVTRDVGGVPVLCPPPLPSPISPINGSGKTDQEKSEAMGEADDWGDFVGS